MISWFERNNWATWIFVLIIAILIFYLSSLTFEPSAGGKGNIKALIYHFSIYFLLAFFLAIALVKGKYKELAVFVLIIGVLYGISDEMHQFFVPGRNLSFFDMFVNSIGVLAAIVSYLTFIEYRNGMKMKKY